MFSKTEQPPRACGLGCDCQERHKVQLLGSDHGGRPRRLLIPATPPWRGTCRQSLLLVLFAIICGF